MQPKILLVDDVKMFLELEASYLQPTDATFLTARDGKEALTLCRCHRPDVVFMDLHMPVMNGADCCMALKKEPELRGIPVVLVTSSENGTDRQACLAAGCDDFLTKPIDRELLLTSAHRFLRQRSSEPGPR